MSNNKDFVVKNAIQIGADTKVTLGTITSSNIDLSTGNYFSDTLTANTTYTFSNAGDVQSFQVEVTGGVAPYDISGAVYDSKSFSVSSQGPRPEDLFFKSDGTTMYTIDAINDAIYQYTLSTAWDVSTASYASKSLDVSSQLTAPTALFVGDSGASLYAVGFDTDTVYQYTLGTAYDVSTGSYASKSFSVASQEAAPTGIFFKPDGTKMYVVGFLSDTVYQYTLSTAWDVSTASYDSISFSVTSQATDPQSLHFSVDGLRMFIADTTTNNVFSYTLSTAWDVSTASYDSISYTISEVGTDFYGLAFSDNGDKFYTTGETNDTVYQYSTTASTITWPTSIEWAGGSAPAAPANGETDLFTISTDDGGTTYHGFKTADNLS